MRPLRTPPAQYLSRESGQDLIETALVLPLLLLIVFGVIELSVLTLRFNTVTNVARHAARAGLLPVSAACNLGCRNNAAESAGAALAASAGLSGADLVISAGASTLQVSRVSVSYNSEFLTATFVQAIGGSRSIKLAATASMKRE